MSRSLALLLLLCAVAPAQAQQPDTTLLSATRIAIADQRPPPVVIAPPPVAAPLTPAFWELISGYEGDTAGSGYGFLGPSYVRAIRPGLSWTARAFANYLTYEFTGAEGGTRVRSPGLSSAVGLQFGERNFFRVLAGPEVKWQRTRIDGADGTITTSSRTRLGANLGGEMYVNPTSNNNIHGLVNYNTADSYSWGRLGFKEQISNRSWEGPTAAFVGVEGIVQGNHDIRSRQAGAFVELTHVPARVSVVFKGGYKRSTFVAGPDSTGPYFAIGFYRRMN